MKIYWLILTVLTGMFELSAANVTDSLLIELDKTLLNGHLYMEQKEHRLNRLKIQLEQELSPDKQYDITYRIIDEYKSYMSDSALVYVNKNIQLAGLQNNMAWLIRAKLQYAFVLSSSGLFIEAESILKSIPRDSMDREMLADYYKGLELLYINISIYQEGKQITLTNYKESIREYRDSVLYFLPDNAPERLFYQFLLADSDNKSDTALAYLKSYLATLYPGTHEHAKKMYSLSMLYEKTGDTEQQIKSLILAVMSDVKDAVKENRALLDLSIRLYNQGNIDRAFAYIQYALNDANFYNARFRYFEISKALPIITSAYQQVNAEHNRKLKSRLYIFSALFLVMLLLAALIYKAAQEKTKKKIKETNENFEELNNNLNRLNRELSEANHIKEEYIGYFIDLCSEYIGNLEDYRKTVFNKIAAKRFDELLRSSGASSDKASEIKDLYANFDRAFLNIYPEFIPSINKLLVKEARFDIKKGDLLNTELRIFALIRLGITDSAKIASFLRCSLQTVYNYRSKMKRNSLDELKDIEEQIRKIGVPCLP
ncbi:MAG: DUF6377 domain-containing protein [Tannerellaceae bacterium]|nr:DUF6377 domain-containing protein [Tannerellaceae bacterium]